MRLVRDPGVGLSSLWEWRYLPVISAFAKPATHVASTRLWLPLEIEPETNHWPDGMAPIPPFFRCCSTTGTGAQRPCQCSADGQRQCHCAHEICHGDRTVDVSRNTHQQPDMLIMHNCGKQSGSCSPLEKRRELAHTCIRNACDAAWL